MTTSETSVQPKMLASLRVSRRARFSIVAGLIGAFALLLNVLTPLVADDWGRAAMMTSFDRVLANSWRFYFEWDGRLINSILGNSTFLVPSFAFDLVNTLAFVGLVLIMYALAAPKARKSVSLLMLIFTLTWLFVPTLGQVALWQLGSAIYLWASAQIFLLVWLFQRFISCGKEIGLATIPRLAVFFAVGVVAGNAAQNGSAGALLILTGYIVATRIKRRRVPSWMVSGWLGTALGFAAVVLAPGNTIREERLASESESLLRQIGSQFNTLMARQFDEMGWLIVFVAALFVIYVSMQRREWHVILTASLLVLAAFAVILVMLAAPPNAASLRTYSFSAFFLIAAAAVLAASIVNIAGRSATLLQRGLVAGLAVLVAYSAIPAVYDAGLMWSADRARMAYVASERESGNFDLVVDQLPPPQTKYRADYRLGDLTTDPDYWRNRGFAQYMRIDNIVVND